MFSYFLYIEFITYPTCGKWSPTLFYGVDLQIEDA